MGNQNPYFSTGGGNIGGSLVGPQSDIFSGNFPGQPNFGNINPNIKYDPIGPFGTFREPKTKSDIKKTDPFSGGNPFNEHYQNFGKNDPFGKVGP